MAMVVKNNMSAVRTLNTLNQNSSALSKSLSRVSSGMKINSAQDDAAGYAISERMRVRIRSLDQANQNTQNDSSLMKTAEGAVANTVELLRALKEKAINAANDSNTDEDRQTIQKELNQFIDQIDDNALVQFNGKYLVDGSKNNASVASKTILLNQSLKEGTLAGTLDSTGVPSKNGTALTNMANRAGDSLGIQSTDKWQVSYVQNGIIHTASGDVGDQDLTSILYNAGITSDIGTAAVTTDDGLIDDKDADLTPGYNAVSTPKETTGESDWTKIATQLKDATDSDGNPLDLDAIQTALTDGTSTEIEYFTTGSDGTIDASNPVKFTVSAANNSSTPAVLEYSITAPPSGLEDDTQLYSKANTTDKAIKVVSGPSANTRPGVKAVLDALGGTTPAAPTAALSANIVSTFTQLGISSTYYTDSTASTKVDLTTSNLTISDPNGDGSSFTWTLNVNGSAASSSTTIYKENPDYVDPDAEIVNNVNDKFDKLVYTPDKTQGLAFVAAKSGVVNQISGLTINIMDQDGNVKKAANAALDQFKQYQRAENKTGDMSLNFHIGSEANVAIKVGLGDMRSEALGLKGSDGDRILVTTKENANAAINVIENALTKALDQQTTIGAVEARLEYTATNLTTSSENVQAAESTIRDADMAKEMTNYTKNNVLLQAAQAMLAQANQNSSAVLSLLQ